MQIPVADFLAAYNRTEKWRIAYIGGTFDCLHRGHLALLANARTLAEQVVVGVNTDEFCARYKRQPLMGLEDRIAVLAACRLVDRVVINTGGENSRPAIIHANADVIIHGSDWTPANGLLQQMGLTAEWLEATQIDMVTLPYTPWTSTSAILAAYDCRKAAVEAND